MPKLVAITNSPRLGSRVLPAVMLGVFLALVPWLAAEESPAATNAFAAWAERSYVESRERWQKDTNAVELCWQFGRACFDRADYSTNDTQRAALAEQGIAVCRRAIQLDSNSAPAYYYLGLNTGQLARTKLLAALFLVRQLEEALLASSALDSSFDFAGAHRSLGVLYRDAPGWPTSIGSRQKARRYLQRAVELAPGFPANRITLLESWLQWGERKSVLPQLGPVEEVLKIARTKLTGEAWAPSWDEWDQRWQAIKTRSQTDPSKSPRESQ